MNGGFSTAQVALLLVALQFGVLTLGWLAAAWLLPDERRAGGWWATYAALNAAALALIVFGMRDADEALRAVGNLLLIAATMAMQRGLWAFMRRPPVTMAHVLLLAAEAVLVVLGMQPQWAPLRIGVGSAIWAGLYLWSGIEVFGHVRRELRLRWGVVCALPLVLTATMLAWRAWRAAASPATVLREVNEDTVLNLGSSVSALVVALVLQLMLLSLLMVRLVRRLERLSRHDALTGLLNRRAVDEELQHEAQRVRRLDGTMSVLMIDIDHFKRLNDAHGHAVGDRALQHLAAVMAAQMREIDLLARWGGEEFLALLPGTSGSDALALAERLRLRLRDAPLRLGDEPVVLTATIGVADWRGRDDSPSALLARADGALYAGKRAGRDRSRLAVDGGAGGPVELASAA